MGFDYFYGRGTEQYAFYQVPKILITDDQFADITTDAKLLYSLMKDRYCFKFYCHNLLVFNVMYLFNLQKYAFIFTLPNFLLTFC